MDQDIEGLETNRNRFGLSPEAVGMPDDSLPTVTGVHHVAVNVDDVDAAVEFFVDYLGAEELYRKGPFGAEDDTMERRLGVHPDARATLAMLRCGPATNLELFEWDAPDDDGEPPALSDTGAAHIGVEVEDIDRALSAVEDYDDVEALEGPHTNDSGPTAGLRYVFVHTEFGVHLELVETPDGAMPYADGTGARLYSPSREGHDG